MDLREKIDKYLNSEGFENRNLAEVEKLIENNLSKELYEEYLKVVKGEGKYGDKREVMKFEAMEIKPYGTLLDLKKSWLRKGSFDILNYSVDEGIIYSGSRVLDLCCASGLEAVFFAEIVGSEGKVMGIDREPLMIEAAIKRAKKRNIRNAEFIVSEADHVILGKSKYDVFTCLCAIDGGLEHFQGEWEFPYWIQKRLKGILPFMDKDSKFVISSATCGTQSDLEADDRGFKLLMDASLEKITSGEIKFHSFDASEKFNIEGYQVQARYRIAYGKFKI